MYGFQEITADQLKDLRDQQGEFILVDVRSPAEVARGVIQGARHIPLHILPMSLQQLDKSKTVVFYCLSGGRSAQAAAFAAAQGFDQVLNLRGGISAWVNRGLPIGQLPGQ
ncbi:rhodanese-like domain-containing protein [Acidithiobacillus sp. M4-SHS-6]|uniref:rhodanese-like domain-containing protein n=1 Tax=Acidithiobacillus sp. M4-SHS-6 TaxID=3383024 RepID=UPI0039BE4E09